MEENRFQIRHGSTNPGKDDLLPYEFGYNKTNEKLYMGREGEGVGPLLINSDLEDFGITVSPTELNYLDGVTSNIQTQLNGKQPTITNATSDEIGCLAGVSSNIQEQLNHKQPAFYILPVTQGGTGANNGEDALSNLGITDYIIDQGISGIWSYRKYASGDCEFWGTVITNTELRTKANTTHSTPYYYSAILSTPNFPFPVIAGSLRPFIQSAHAGIWISSNDAQNSTTTAKFRLNSTIIRDKSDYITYWQIKAKWN